MITIRLKGGLGNQMFQYAFAKGLSKKLGTSFQMDCSLLLDRARQEQVVYRDYDLNIFNVEENFIINPKLLQLLYKIRSASIGKALRELTAIGKGYIKEKQFHLDSSLLDNPINNSIYEGWWQSSDYWKNVTDELRRDFSFKDNILETSIPLLDKIHETNSVCLNVRRTDFVNNPALNVTNLDYFNKAVLRMADLVDKPNFFIFSDDLIWCKENLKLNFPCEVVDHAHKGVKFSNYLQLMSACRNFIIPNSSFAWWAVWLSNKKDQNVIAPAKWFNIDNVSTSDLVSDKWILLEN